jgi:hypothetical protein
MVGDRCYGLSKICNGGEQPVPPHVWYGTTCLLIWDAIGSVSCSVAWGKAWHLA